MEVPFGVCVASTIEQIGANLKRDKSQHRGRESGPPANGRPFAKLSQHQHDDHDGRDDAREEKRHHSRSDVGLLHALMLAHLRGRTQVSEDWVVEPDEKQRIYLTVAVRQDRS